MERDESRAEVLYQGERHGRHGRQCRGKLLPAVAMLILNSYHIYILSPGSGCRVHQGRHREARRRDRQAGVAAAVAHHVAGRIILSMNMI